MTHRIAACRVCNSTDLPMVVDLGRMALTGVFPKQRGTPVLVGDLRVVRCGACGLAQLDRTYPLEEMYAPGYGYRSSLNASMRRHLFGIAEGLWKYAPERSTIIDIGSNDGTLLGFMPPNTHRIGVDPLAEWMQESYPRNASLITDFFPSRALDTLLLNQKASVVTSIAMFYDLESPVEFARAVEGLLTPNGVWLTEQCYMPGVIQQGIYDVICHEHVEYYSVTDMKRIADEARLKIIDVGFSDTNGGSFSVLFARANNPTPEFAGLYPMIEQEALSCSPEAWARFAAGIDAHARGIHDTLQRYKDDGVLVLGYGASTKGNVLLQRANITKDLLPVIAEVNPSKWGCYTPGDAMIPIISEAEARARNPKVFFVLPWHFRGGIIKREQAFLEGGGALFFPFPVPEIISV